MDVFARTISPRGTRWARGAPPQTSSAISRFIRARRSKAPETGDRPERGVRVGKQNVSIACGRCGGGRGGREGEAPTCALRVWITPRKLGPSRSVFTVVSRFTRDTSGVSHESSLMTTLCATLSSLRLLFVVLFVTFPSETLVPVPCTRMLERYRGCSRYSTRASVVRGRYRVPRRPFATRLVASASAVSCARLGRGEGRSVLGGASDAACEFESLASTRPRPPPRPRPRPVVFPSPVPTPRLPAVAASRRARHRLGSLYLFFFRNSRSPRRRCTNRRTPRTSTRAATRARTDPTNRTTRATLDDPSPPSLHVAARISRVRKDRGVVLNRREQFGDDGVHRANARESFPSSSRVESTSGFRLDEGVVGVAQPSKRGEFVASTSICRNSESACGPTSPSSQRTQSSASSSPGYRS